MLWAAGAEKVWQNNEKNEEEQQSEGIMAISSIMTHLSLINIDIVISSVRANRQPTHSYRGRGDGSKQQQQIKLK